MPKIKLSNQVQGEEKDQEIEFELRVSQKSRSMRLSVYPGGKLIVSAPRSASAREIESFIRRKSQWILDKVEKFKGIAPPLGAVAERKRYLQYKKQALVLAQERVREMNLVYGNTFKYGKISVRNQKTRWGSCSKQGNLAFNYKLVFLAPNVRDYLIVHELCHTAEFNHSQKFWALVAKASPNYKQLRKELNKGGFDSP